jgi:xanthine dehydrogenase molybdopterin-binding subunit B
MCPYACIIVCMNRGGGGGGGRERQGVCVSVCLCVCVRERVSTLPFEKPEGVVITN